MEISHSTTKLLALRSSKAGSLMRGVGIEPTRIAPRDLKTLSLTTRTSSHQESATPSTTTRDGFRSVFFTRYPATQLPRNHLVKQVEPTNIQKLLDTARMPSLCHQILLVSTAGCHTAAPTPLDIQLILYI